MNYEILEVHIEYNPKLALIVAIQSSPGRFKAYRSTDSIISLSEISHHFIVDAAKYGRKIEAKVAKIYFPRLWEKMHYEG